MEEIEFPFAERPDRDYQPRRPTYVRPPVSVMGKRDPRNPALKKTGRPELPLPGLYDNIKPFTDPSELDAWMESCMNPNVDHHPVTVTEQEWQEFHRHHRH